MQISRFAQSRLAVFERTFVWLDHHATRRRNPSPAAAHLTTGLRGEDAAYFYLRRLGYIVVARRWRSPKLQGDVDLVGWDGETLCFIEVKTRTSRDFQPAEAAVDPNKRTMLSRMAKEYLRHIDNFERISIRFDVMSVYFSQSKPEFEIFRGAFALQ